MQPMHPRLQPRPAQEHNTANFVMLGRIGQGAFSQVHKVRRISDGRIYALKRIKLSALKPKEQQYAISEIKILAALECPYIISFRQSFYDPEAKELCIVMEWANEGDLQGEIERRRKQLQQGASKASRAAEGLIPESEIWRAIRDILQGLSTLHSASILHRDIKPANVFLSDGVYKLGDLNIAKLCPGVTYAYTQTGTPYYASPEVWKELPYDTKSDIWSFGCVVYEMCNLEPPFASEDMGRLYEMVTRGGYRGLRAGYSPELARLVGACLKVDPKQRMGCLEILAADWVRAKLREYSIPESITGEGALTGVDANVQHNSSVLGNSNKEVCLKISKQLRQLRSCTEPLDRMPGSASKHRYVDYKEKQNQMRISQILPDAKYPAESRHRNPAAYEGSECVGSAGRQQGESGGQCEAECGQQQSRTKQVPPNNNSGDSKQQENPTAPPLAPVQQQQSKQKHKRSKKKILMLPVRPPEPNYKEILMQQIRCRGRLGGGDTGAQKSVDIQKQKPASAQKQTQKSGYHDKQRSRQNQKSRELVDKSLDESVKRQIKEIRSKVRGRVQTELDHAHSLLLGEESRGKYNYSKILQDIKENYASTGRAPSTEPSRQPRGAYKLRPLSSSSRTRPPCRLRPVSAAEPCASLVPPQELPRIRQMLASRSNNIRQQIGKMYYQYPLGGAGYGGSHQLPRDKAPSAYLRSYPRVY